MKTNNIIMGVLVAVIAVMGVAFAAFSTQLTINGTASIQSNWSIEFEAGNNGNCTAVSKDAGAPSSGTVTVENGIAQVKAKMSSPGDSLKCQIIVKNTGSLPAIRTRWSDENGETMPVLGITKDNMYAYSFALDDGNPPLENGAGSQPLEVDGTETLYINLEYSGIIGQPSFESNGTYEKPSEAQSFTFYATYEQYTGA